MKTQAAWTPLRRFTSVSVALQAVAVMVVILVAGAAYYQLHASRRDVIEETARQMARLDMVFAEQTGRAVEAVDLLVSGALETVQLRLIEHEKLDGVAETLRRRIKGVRQLASVTVVDASGAVLVATDPNPAVAPDATIQALLARYRENPKAGLLIGTPFRLADGKWNALLARPMLDGETTLAGMAVGSIALSYFEDFYRAVELNENGAINLHLRDGTVLARFPHVDNIIGTSFGDLPPFKDVLAHALSGTLQMESPVDGNVRVVAIRALRAFPLAVMVSVERGRILVDWRQGAFALVLVAVLLGGTVVILLLTLARRSRQVERLLEQTKTAQMLAEQANDRLLQQISERERAEGALRQAQRIEAIGQLTGGVAHDFNNLLTVVMGNVEFLQRRHAFGGDGTATARLQAIRTAAERGATLTGHLLAFARRQPLMPKPVDLNATIRGMGDLLDSALGMRARAELRLSDDLWPAMVDQSQIELVILNLAINARDAMPVGGVVTIETANHRRTECAAADGPPPGDYVRVTVHDTGAGMSPETLARAFEPFFTTKPPGAGSGLGLSQVFGTARQSGGEVRIESELGRGTSVTVDLPRAVVPPALCTPGATQLLTGSNATVLLVDDEEAVRKVTAAILRDIGYNVREAADGPEALAILEQDIGIDVLLTDLVMPGMNGSQLAIAVKARHPDIAVVFLSGYADSLGDALTQQQRLIRKPFVAADLHQAIEAALADRRQAA